MSTPSGCSIDGHREVVRTCGIHRKRVQAPYWYQLTIRKLASGSSLPYICISTVKDFRIITI